MMRQVCWQEAFAFAAASLFGVPHLYGQSRMSVPVLCDPVLCDPVLCHGVFPGFFSPLFRAI